VTNEGNATLTTTLPKVHVAISGIEKIVPTLEDVATLMRLSAPVRDGTIDLELCRPLDRPQRGGRIPRRRAHVLHRRRSAGAPKCSGSDVRAALRCIRCGACMNHCPVYQNVGGHAYGWVYPGPIGSI
jgi:L-lactate dehydrogenase complex protein LldF